MTNQTAITCKSELFSLRFARHYPNSGSIDGDPYLCSNFLRRSSATERAIGRARDAADLRVSRATTCQTGRGFSPTVIQPFSPLLILPVFVHCDVCPFYFPQAVLVFISSSLLLAFFIYFSISFIAILLHLGQYLLNPFVLSIPRSTCQPSLLCAGLFSFSIGYALN